MLSNFMDIQQFQHIYMQESTQEILTMIQAELDFAIFEKRYDKAHQLLLKALSIQEDGIEVLRILSRVQFECQKYSACVNTCSKLIKADPTDIQPYTLMMKCYIELNNLENAMLVQNQLQQNFPLSVCQNLQSKLLPKEEQIMNKMKNWLEPAGSHFGKLKVVRLQKDYRGVIATKFIRKKQLILFVPKAQMITLQMAKLNRFSKVLLKNNAKFFSYKHTYLSIFLLEQRANPMSKFTPYFDFLPSDHSCFPINFTTEELTELIGSNFLIQIKEKVVDLKTDYNSILEFCPEFALYTFKDFCWARTIIGSRIFGLMMDGVRTEALVPFADMLNHKMPKQTTWNYSADLNGFYIESLVNIDAGQEVCDSYGRKCNSRFLLSYGFLLEQNPDNQVCLRVNIDESDALGEMKLRMLGKEREQILVYKITENLEDGRFLQLMGFLRFKLVSAQNDLRLLEKISEGNNNDKVYNPSRTPPISLQLQLICWRVFENLCSRELQQFPTTLDQDQSLLQKYQEPSNMRNILILRMGQKKLYSKLINLAKQAIQVLQQGRAEAIKIIEAKREDSKLFNYMSKIMLIIPKKKDKCGVLLEGMLENGSTAKKELIDQE